MAKPKALTFEEEVQHWTRYIHDQLLQHGAAGLSVAVRLMLADRNCRIEEAKKRGKAKA